MNFDSSPVSFLFSPVKLKIAEFVVQNEFSMSERELSRLLGVSHMSVNRTMRELEAMNVVGKVRVGNAYVWKAKRLSYAYQVLCEFLEALAAVGKPLDELKADILKTLPLEKIERIVLFGSVAGKKERAESDIDLHVLAKSAGGIADIEKGLERLGAICLEKYGHPLSPYVRTLEQSSSGEYAELHKEIEKRIVIYLSESSGEMI